MSFWLSLSSAMPHTSLAGECPSWSAFFGRYEGFSTRCAWRQTPHPVRDATAYFREFPFRNCLENRDRRRIGVPKGAKRGRGGPDRSLPGVEEARSIGLRPFSKQFLQALRCIKGKRFQSLSYR